MADSSDHKGGGEQLATDWRMVAQILSLLERFPVEISQRRFSKDDKCKMLFSQIFLYFAPHNASLARYSIDLVELKLQVRLGLAYDF